MTAVFRGWIARLRALVRRDAISREIRDEMAFHVELRAAQYRRAGLSARDAARAARRRFGNPIVMRDRGYDIRGGGVMETVLQDIRYGARQLIRQPLFSIVAIATLALSIGASSALFGVIDAALVRPLPYPHPEELVDVTVSYVDAREPMHMSPSMADLRKWKGETSVFTHVGMGRVTGFTPLIVDAGEPARLQVGEASDDFFETYGVVPIIGRTFQIDDTRKGAPAVALLGYSFWRSQFNGDPDVLGRTLRIQDTPATVIGVLAAGFYPNTAVWQPTAAIMRGSGTPVVGRLRPGLSVDEAAKALTGHTDAAPIYSKRPSQAIVQLSGLYATETFGYRTTLNTLAAAVGVIVLIACVNIAGLLLARGSARQTELAIRASIGAGRGRLVRQLLTESLLLAAIGAALGLALAWTTLDAVVTLVPISLPANSPVAINLRVLAATTITAIVAATLFGLVPAFRLSRAARTFGSQLASAGRRVGNPFSRRGGQWLIGIEVALALTLLASAGLVIRSFARLLSVDVGFNPTAVTTMAVEPVDQASATRAAYYEQLATVVRALPEVESAGTIDALALRGGRMYGGIVGDQGGDIFVPQIQVGAGYFEALGLRAIAGALPSLTDTQAVAVVDATFAARHFGGSPVGHSLNDKQSAQTFPIVAVVPDVRFGGPQGRVEGDIYLRNSNGQSALSLVIRPRPGASLRADRLRQIAQSLGPRVVIGDIRSAADLLGEQVVRPRHRMLLLSLLGGFGLVLALVGIFSMTAYAVTRRTQEIGVRMAFGATPSQVVGLVVAGAAWPVVLGLVAGLGGAYYATRIVQSFLFQTAPHDVGTFATAAVVLAAAGCLAAWIPARRAARVDPVAALRTE